MSGNGMPFIVTAALLAAMAAAQSSASDPFAISLVKPFQTQNWLTSGTPEFNEKIAILTTKKNREGPQVGGLWNPTPFPYKSNFNITLRTKITGNRDEADKNGQGLALWLVENPDDKPLNEKGPVNGGRDRFRGLGIVFDTIDNDQRRNNPSISAHYLDGNTPYPHQNDGLSTQLAGCVADYRRSNIVSTKISYNSTHLSVYVDLTGNDQFRKCLLVPLQMRTDRDWYLGVTAETIENGKPQETHDVHAIEVTGTPDWSRPKPPTAQPTWQQQPPQQQAWQQPPPPQQQPTPASQSKPASAPWTETATDDSSALHDKIDQLVKASTHTALESAQAGEALKEVQTNVLQRVQQATNAIMAQLRRMDNSVASHLASSTAQIEALTKLAESTKGSVDAGRVDTERRSNAVDAQISALQATVKEMNEIVVRLSKSFQMQISREISKGTARMAAAASKGGRDWWGGWFWLSMFQIVFVAFLVYRHVTNKKLDKLRFQIIVSNYLFCGKRRKTSSLIDSWYYSNHDVASGNAISSYGPSSAFNPKPIILFIR